MTYSTRHCITCGSSLNDERLAAIPEAVQCAQCVIAQGDEPRLKGRMIWSHKTAPEIEIGTQFAAQAKAKQRYGMTLSPVPHAAQLQVFGKRIEMPWEHVETYELMRQVERGTETSRPDEGLEAVRLHANCCPDRPRATPDGKCVECAVEWYARSARGTAGV